MIELSDSLLAKYGKMRDASGQIVPLIEREPWRPPALTPEQQKEQDEYIKLHNLPF